MTSLSSDSDNFNKWKARKLVKKQEEFNDLWQNDILDFNDELDASRTRLQALQEKLDSVNQENITLLSQQKGFEAKIALQEQKNNLLDNEICDLKTVQLELETRIADLKELQENLERKLVLQVEQEKENIKSSEDKVRIRLRDKERALQAKEEAQRHNVENLEKRILDLKDGNRMLKQELNKVEQQYEKDREVHMKTTAKIQFDYQVDMRTAKMKNKVLTDRVEALSTTTDDKIKENENLREKIKTKNQELEKQKVEIADLMIQIEALVEKMEREENRTSSLTEKIMQLEKELESTWNKFEIEHKAHKFTKKHSGLILRKHSDLVERIKFLDHRIRSHQASILKLETQLLGKATFIKNVSLDIENAMSLVNYPKKFIKEVTRIKAKHFDDDKDAGFIDTPEAVFQAVGTQKSRFDRYETTIRNLRKQLKQKELDTMRQIEKLEKPRSDLIRIVNDQRREMAKGKNELNEIIHLLKTVTNYLPQKIQLWVKDRLGGATVPADPELL
ncbi:centriole and centriolar satellite protein OFD1-like [Nerophis ophidion]|uniref:centriole and centriolar satellite protein OFD1-like n=1 Tax=Nerophis ophidion TaxID=159077 RepID=UPI002AE01E51|nr:centriole and centriolar satellite protein OFD1-like [Nerophis ophidion]